jgi:hypothetical protein
MSEEVVDRLDRLIAMFALANRDALTQVAREVRSDNVNAALLDATADDWVPAGALTEAVAKSTKVSPRTVRTRTAELLAAGALKRRGSGPSIQYRSTGVI